MAELTDQDREQLRALIEDEWVAACGAGEWDTAAALCTEAVDYMPADSPWVRGRSEVAGFLSGFPEIIGMSQSVTKIAGDGSLAVLHATFDIRFVVEGQKLEGRGKVLGTAAKESSGWLFSSVCFNWDAPPAPSL
jgi:ketosteroid isomerase-like protein